MSGLLLKDLLILKGGWKSYAVMVVIFAGVSLIGATSYFSSMVTMFLLILPMSSFSTDELARWDKFAAALPGGRRAVVRAKYQFLFLTMAGVLALCCLVNLAIVLLGRGEDTSWLTLARISLAGTLVGLLLNVILYPFLFRFGSQKARLVLGLIFGVAFAAFVMGAAIFSLNGTARLLEHSVMPLLAAAAVILVVVATVVSYRISCRVYEKKEFYTNL